MSADVTAYLDGLELLHGAVYRGVEDQRRLTMEHDALPALVDAVRAVLALADENEAAAQRQVDRYSPDSDPLPAAVGRAWVNAAREFRAVVTAALSVTEPTP